MEYNEENQSNKYSDNTPNLDCECCFITTENITSRHCFITGEYCSKQTSIQTERDRLHHENKIKAFVIMNFSDMSEVVYRWRIKDFVASLAKNLYLAEDESRLYCCAYEIEKDIPDGWKQINEIEVIRSDTEPASNYVICSRICQQIQIADLIIVDVSTQNPNVFYEFGMAVSLGKLVLPICFSESYYKMVLPKELKEKRSLYTEVEHHIGCYPWRKQLFEYYGIRYKRKNPQQLKTEYLEYKVATDERYGFPDTIYNRFPYHEYIKKDENQKTGNKEEPDEKDKIGWRIYDKLSNEYNGAEWDHNTLVVYTMDGFLNGDQAGHCVVNFYRNIIARTRLEQCFCGERVGVLVQGNFIPESDKDAKEQLNLLYNIGEIILIGLNQATYLATEDKIKSHDFLHIIKKFDLDKYPDNQSNDDPPVPTAFQTEEMIRLIKGHIRNRGMLIYPDYPVYVNRITSKLHENILEEPDYSSENNFSSSNTKAFCLYHVMLRTLRYTNEIVVDISNNSIQSLFWLGAAHGSDIYAVTVLHAQSKKERKIIAGTAAKQGRNIFDVAGLWTAIYHSHDTEGFYKQLALVQSGIERHSKLRNEGKQDFEKKIKEYLETGKNNIEEQYRENKNKEEKALEAYYRNCLWDAMLCYNRLRLYVPQIDDINSTDKEPRVRTARWDFDSVSSLSHYLSRRTVIGEYLIMALQDRQHDQDGGKVNFICIGQSVEPLKEDLREYIHRKISKFSKPDEKDFNIIYGQINSNKKENFCEGPCSFKNDKKIKRIYKGFRCIGGKQMILTHHPQIICINCDPLASSLKTESVMEPTIYTSASQAESDTCKIRNRNEHIEMAQLVLWRESNDNRNEHSYFRVGFYGSSGPATFALSTLFIDDDQRYSHLKKQKGVEEGNLLCKLQTIVREKFMDKFYSAFQKHLKIVFSVSNQENLTQQQKRYAHLVWHAISYYLSTVLYRYFFPFLLETDIKRIHNGMRVYVHSMMEANASPFAREFVPKIGCTYSTPISTDHVIQMVEEIPKALLEVLRNFKGLEAFYEVTVKHGSSDITQDTRQPLKITMMNPQDGNAVHCFYTD